MATDTDSEHAQQQANATMAASGYRQRVSRALTDGPATPSQLEAETGIDMSHVSRALSNLRDVGAVELAVPEETQKGRLYRLTERGETALEVVRG